MSKEDLRDTAIVIISLLVAMATGFLRQTAVASTLGAGRATDIFLVAYSLPEFVYTALPIVLSPVVIPLFMQVSRQKGETAAWQVARRLGIWLVVGSLAFTALIAWGAPVLLTWLSSGFDAGERSRAIAVYYTMLPGLLFMGISTLMGALLQVYRRFARPALTTALYNIVFVLGLYLLPFDDPLERTGPAVTLGALAALLFQLPLLLRVRHQVSGPPAKGSVDLRPTFRLLGWMAAGYGVHHLILFIDRSMATAQGEGSAAILNFGYHLALSVGQVSGLAVSTVLFPSISEAIEADDLNAARRFLNRAMGMVLAMAFPAGLAVILLRQPIVQVLLEYGAFTASDTQAVGFTLAIYTLSVVADTLCQPLWRLVYAWKDGRIVLAVNGIQTLIRLAANLILVKQLGYNGIAFSAVLGLVMQLAILGSLAHRRLGWRITSSGRRWAVVVALASGLAGAAMMAVKTGAARLLPESSPWLSLIASGVALLVVYGGFLTGVFLHPLHPKEGYFFDKD